MSIYHGNRRWFSLLVPNNLQSSDHISSLYDVYKTTPTCIILCYENYRSKLRYSFFQNIVHVYNFLINHDINDLYFHEVINGNYPTKLYFDIDISDKIEDFDEKLLFSELVGILVNIFQERFNVDLDLSRDFIWLSSSGPEKKQDGSSYYKRSYHLIIDNYSFADMDEVRYVAYLIKNLLSDRVRAWFDWVIYNYNKNFRILHSKKRSSNRRLSFCSQWYYNKQKIKYRSVENYNNIDEEHCLQYSASLITNTDYCKVMIRLISLKPNLDIEKFDDQITQEAYEIMKTKYEELPFEIYKIGGSSISLRRLRPSYCNICEVEHEHENPFLLLKREYNYIEVRFYCRRSTDNCRSPNSRSDNNYEILGQISDKQESKIDNYLLSENAIERLVRPKLERSSETRLKKIELMPKIDRKKSVQNINTEVVVTTNTKKTRLKKITLNEKLILKSE